MIYAAAVVVAGKPTPPVTNPTRKKKEHSTSSLKKVNRAVGRQPQNKFREKEIGTIRKKIAKLTDLCKRPSKKKAHKLRHILKGKDAKSVLQDLRMKLSAKSKKIRAMKLKNTKFVNNRLFFTNQKQFYSQLRGETSKAITNPPPEKGC